MSACELLCLSHIGLPKSFKKSKKYIFTRVHKNTLSANRQYFARIKIYAATSIIHCCCCFFFFFFFFFFFYKLVNSVAVLCCLILVSEFL